MKYLIVVAHPDDESLGCGGTISRLTKEGNEVAVTTLCNEASVRFNLSSSLADEQLSAYRILGVTTHYFGTFPNIKMNTVPHLELVQFIENCIEKFLPDVIITHHPSDTNNDHVVTSYAAQAAMRLFQRRPNVNPIKKFMYMEVASSTEWCLDSTANKFNPNYFVEIGKNGLETKLKALDEYSGIMRAYPHPRSKESITGIAAFRGSQSGLNYAEAFECVFWRE